LDGLPRAFVAHDQVVAVLGEDFQIEYLTVDLGFEPEPQMGKAAVRHDDVLTAETVGRAGQVRSLDVVVRARAWPLCSSTITLSSGRSQARASSML
jgi:hypothetical protein